VDRELAFEVSPIDDSHVFVRHPCRPSWLLDADDERELLRVLAERQGVVLPPPEGGKEGNGG
jgi:hypothetical protein